VCATWRLGTSSLVHVSGLVKVYLQMRSFIRFAKNAGDTDGAVKRDTG